MAELLENLGYKLRFSPYKEEKRMHIECLKDDETELEIILPDDPLATAFIIQKSTGDVGKFSSIGSRVDFFHPHYHELQMGLGLVDTLLELMEINLHLDLMWVLAEDILKGSGRNFFSEKRIKALLTSRNLEEFSNLILSHPLLKKSKNRYTFPSNLEDYILVKRIIARPDEWNELKVYIRLNTLNFLKKPHSPSIKLVEKQLARLKERHVKNQQYEEAARLRNIQTLFWVEVYRRAWPDIEQADGDEIFRDLVAEHGLTF